MKWCSLLLLSSLVFSGIACQRFTAADVHALDHHGEGAGHQKEGTAGHHGADARVPSAPEAAADPHHAAPAGKTGTVHH